jgi:hypothetical protein
MEPAKNILLRTRPNGSTPWMRLPDWELDLENATDLTKYLLSNIEHHATFRWPDSISHRYSRYVPRNLTLRIQDPTEDNDQYRERLRLIDATPQRETDEEAAWLKCAIIVSAALSFMTEQERHGTTRFEDKGILYFFDPRKFYNYMWICLNQGQGTKAWEIKPPQPPKDLGNDEMANWYAGKAEAIVTEVRARWDEGVYLRLLLLRWAPPNMHAVDVA